MSLIISTRSHEGVVAGVDDAALPAVEDWVVEVLSVRAVAPPPVKRFVDPPHPVIAITMIGAARTQIRGECTRPQP
jgi:hypothetical protein